MNKTRQDMSIHDIKQQRRQWQAWNPLQQQTYTDHLASPLVDKSGRYYKMAEIWTSKFGAYFMLNENRGE